MIGERPDHYFYPFWTNLQAFRFGAVAMILFVIVFQIFAMKEKTKLRYYIWVHVIIFIAIIYFWNSAYKLDLSYRPFLEFYKEGICYYGTDYKNEYYPWHEISDLKYREEKGGRSIIFKMKDKKYNYMKNYSLPLSWRGSDLKLIGLMQDYIAKAKENPPAPDAPERVCATLPEKS